MNLDVNSFGYGVGLVMLGWACGLAVKLAFSVIARIKDI